MVGLLVHDWIEKIGGSETVLVQMHNLLPDADVLTLWNNHPLLIPGNQVHETFLRFAPAAGRKAASLPLMPAVWRHTIAARKDYDWIIASSHSFAHHVRAKVGVKKLVYAHTPARYLWAPELDSRGNSRAARLVAPALKAVDRRRAGEATSIAVNSHYISKRVRLAWKRDSTVIYPPVRVSLIQRKSTWASSLNSEESALLQRLPREFVLGASRFIAYKRLDRVIRTGEISGFPVVLAGSGPEAKRLQEYASEAGVPVFFVDKPSDGLLFALYERAALFVFPAIEDFGIMPVEAAATGTPVMVSGVGGAAESVLPGITGAVVDFDSDADIAAGVEQAAGCSRSDSRAHAAKFGADDFERNFSTWVNASLEESVCEPVAGLCGQS
jgi:glycosyltransferase involved in cell wall biosynthesis